MLNHVKKGMERTYDLYEMEDEKRGWFLKWENKVIGLAKFSGVAEGLSFNSLFDIVPTQIVVLSDARLGARPVAAPRLG